MPVSCLKSITVINFNTISETTTVPACFYYLSVTCYVNLSTIGRAEILPMMPLRSTQYRMHFPEFQTVTSSSVMLKIDFSASSTIRIAIRSLMLLPGFMNSTLA